MPPKSQKSNTQTTEPAPSASQAKAPTPSQSAKSDSDTTTLPTSSSSVITSGSSDAEVIHGKLVCLGYYLGSPDIMAKLDWSGPTPSGNQLIQRQNGAEHVVPEEAVLSVVGEISMKDFWLTGLGGWTPKNMFNQPLVKARARCRLVSVTHDPRLERFKADWPTYIKNLGMLQKAGWGQKSFSKVYPAMTDNGITLTHNLFVDKEVTHHEEGENAVNPSGTASNSDEEEDMFPPAQWGVTKEVMTHLEEIKKTHDLIPIPAFDMSGRPIPPTQYETRLRGAIVEAHFTLVAWAFGTDKGVMTAQLRELIVLVPPTPAVRSPMKRKSLKDGPSTSPKKVKTT